MWSVVHRDKIPSIAVVIFPKTATQSSVVGSAYYRWLLAPRIVLPRSLTGIQAAAKSQGLLRYEELL